MDGAETAAQPGTPGNPVQLTDPKMMRALAHQGRIAIWTYLGLHGPATATECAEIAGLSPSACSYHLRTLARYGFVEEDPASAEEWQAAAGELFSVAHVTPEELERMRKQVIEVMAPYVRMEPDSRPAGALPVRITLDLFPWFGPEEAR